MGPDGPDWEVIIVNPVQMRIAIAGLVAVVSLIGAIILEAIGHPTSELWVLAASGASYAYGHAQANGDKLRKNGGKS
jgi:hypothetical protein